MKSFAKIVFIFFLALPLIGQADHNWGPYHWSRKANPFTLKVGDNLALAWKSYLNQAVCDWTHPVPPELTPTNCAVPSLTPPSPVLLKIVPGTSKKNCSMVSGTIQVCNSGYGKNGWLGLATINITGGVHITQGSAKMNDSYFSMLKYNNPNEKLHVVCQEIAHTFGLDHQSEDGSSQNSCMDYFSNTGINAASTLSTTPNAHDFEELWEIYAHSDPTDLYLKSNSLAGGPDLVDHNDPNSWGQLVSQSRNGRGSVYERIHGPSSKSVTHVYWTEEAAESCPSCDHRYPHHD